MALCARPGCGGYRSVRCRAEQREARYCSRRCAALVTQNIRKADWSAAGRKSGQARRQHTRALIEQCATKEQAFRLGYARGLASKWRALRQRYVVEKKRSAA